jgi:hypothetical protein
MALNLFTSKVDALKIIDGISNVLIGDKDNADITAAVVGNGNFLFDPKTGKVWSSDGSVFTDTTESLTAGTTDNTILKWDAGTSAWVEETDFTVTDSGLATAADGFTASGGDIVATAGNVTAGGGTVTAGDSDTAGTVDIKTGTGAGVILTSSAAHTLEVGTAGSDNGIIENLANPTSGKQASNKDYVDLEDGYLRSFTGKNAAGSETPTYSSTNYVTQSASLESAIGELDADVFNAISALRSGVSWKGLARFITGTGVFGSADLSSAGNSPVALPATGVDYFTDDNTPTQTLIGQDTIEVNEYIMYSGAGTDLLWKRVGTNLVVQAAPAVGDTYGALVDLIQTTDVLENNTAIYMYNASSDWIKIGEFAVGQIQDGSTADTIPTWNTTDNTWKQNSGLTISGTAITGTAASAVTIAAASGQDVNVSTTGAGGDILFTSAAGSAAIAGTTQTSLASMVNDGSVVISSAGAVQVRSESGQQVVLRSSTTNDVVLFTATTDQESATVTNAVATTGYVRTDVVQREVNAAVNDTESQAITVNADAVKFYVKVKGNTTATDAYASEIMAVVDSATTVDTTEYAMVGKPTLASIAIARVSATSISCTVTNNTGEVATVAIHAIPIR